MYGLFFLSFNSTKKKRLGFIDTSMVHGRHFHLCAAGFSLPFNCDKDFDYNVLFPDNMAFKVAAEVLGLKGLMAVLERRERGGAARCWGMEKEKG